MRVRLTNVPVRLPINVLHESALATTLKYDAVVQSRVLVLWLRDFTQSRIYFKGPQACPAWSRIYFKGPQACPALRVWTLAPWAPVQITGTHNQHKKLLYYHCSLTPRKGINSHLNCLSHSGWFYQSSCLIRIEWCVWIQRCVTVSG